MGRLIVKCTLRGIDVQIVTGPPGFQHAPSEGKVTIATFRINGTLQIRIALLARGPRRRYGRQENLTLHDIGNRKMHRPQDGRRDVNQPDPVLHFRPGGLPGKLEQQRDVDGFVVKKNAVMLFAVLSERLTMIRHNGNQTTLEKTPRPQLPEELSDDGVGVSNLPIVRLSLISRSVWLWRRIGIMRIVKMNPKKEWPRGMSAEPGDGTIHDLSPPALQ